MSHVPDHMRTTLRNSDTHMEGAVTPCHLGTLPWSLLPSLALVFPVDLAWEGRFLQKTNSLVPRSVWPFGVRWIVVTTSRIWMPGQG